MHPELLHVQRIRLQNLAIDSHLSHEKRAVPPYHPARNKGLYNSRPSLGKPWVFISPDHKGPRLFLGGGCISGGRVGWLVSKVGHQHTELEHTPSNLYQQAIRNEHLGGWILWLTTIVGWKFPEMVVKSRGIQSKMLENFMFRNYSHNFFACVFGVAGGLEKKTLRWKWWRS